MNELIARIRTASPDELTELAAKLRERIIDVVSETGGHLAPSLGVVELTIALHHVFESPRDSIIWDVGHQAYAHKLITGRNARFETLRQLGGISGFPKISESVHDSFGVGHSSTSISAALGLAEAKRMAGELGKTIAVIGDGAMTAGLAYEGLNNAGHVQNKRLIVILNDNQMSIGRNVGALAKFMNRGLTNPTYNRLRRDFKALFKLFSTKSLNLAEISRRGAMVVKDFFLAGNLFEAFGFRYIGPVDGHDFTTLVPTLKNIASNIDEDEEKSRPVLLHVITRKGKGYAPAEKDPAKFHGIGSFDVSNGAAGSAVKPSEPTYTKVFGETLYELMKVDNRVIAITAAMPSGTGLDLVKEKFPGRYYDVGIAEPHAAVFAAGMASRGFRPVVAIYSSFLQRAYDAIVHDICLQNLPVIFAVDRAGLVGEDGPTHHGVMDLSFLRHIPNLAIMSPKDEEELRLMLWTAVGCGRPIALRYPRGKAVGAELGTQRGDIPLGAAEVLTDPTDASCTLFAIGNMVAPAAEAARMLGEDGIKVSVVNARFVKPLDEATLLRQAARGHAIVTIEDNLIAGGFGSAVLESLNTNGFADVPVVRMGYPDEFTQHGPIGELHRMYGLTPTGIVQAVRRAIPASVNGDAERKDHPPKFMETATPNAKIIHQSLWRRRRSGGRSR